MTETDLRVLTRMEELGLGVYSLVAVSCCVACMTI